MKESAKRFFEGFSSVIEIWPAKVAPRKQVSGTAQDWRNVGSLLRGAMKKHDESRNRKAASPRR